MAITSEKKVELSQEFGHNPGDTGSAEVQVAMLTHRINNLTEHMRSNRRDFGTQRGLLAMVSRRRRHLDYLKKTNPAVYLQLLTKLGIRR